MDIEEELPEIPEVEDSYIVLDVCSLKFIVEYDVGIKLISCFKKAEKLDGIYDKYPVITPMSFKENHISFYTISGYDYLRYKANHILRKNKNE